MTSPGAAATGLQGLEDEREVLLASLRDLEREHRAGDISDDDYVLLRDRYTARAASVLRAIEKQELAQDSPSLEDGDEPVTPPALSASNQQEEKPKQKTRSIRHSRKRVAIVLAAGLVALIALSLVLVVQGTSSRLPGETVSGSVSLSGQQQLQRSLTQAETLESQGNASEALEIYRQVLSRDPNQTEALAETGWLEFEAGVEAKNSKLLSQGQEEEQKAEHSDPSAFTPHLYLGSMYLVENDAADSVAQYRLFLADDPPAQSVSSAAQFIDRAFADAHLPAPPLPSGS